MPAPKGYKAGVGRGATGFTTRGEGPLRTGRPLGDKNPDRFEDAGLFSKRQDKDDKDADKVYEELEARMTRPKKRKPAEEPEAAKIADQFTSLKSDLEKVSVDEWANLPEAADVTRRNKRLKQELDSEKRSYAVPDWLAGRPRQLDNSTESESNQGAKEILNARLDYALKQAGRSEDSEVSRNIIDVQSKADTDRKRELFEAMIKTEPSQPQGYIGLARLEESAHRPKKARAAIQRALDNCPKVPQVWLEAVRLHPLNDAKAIIARGVKVLKNDPKLWLAAVDLEDTTDSKLQIVHQALEENISSGELWTLAVKLENPADQKMVVEQALEFAPTEELYLLASNLDESPQTVLAKAREALPESKQLWLATAKLGDAETVLVEAVTATGSPGWLDLAKENIDIAPAIISAIDISKEDIAGLRESGTESNTELARLGLAKIANTPELYLQWADIDGPHVLRKAVKEFPDNEDLWIRFLESNVDLAVQEQPTEKVLLSAADIYLKRGLSDKALQVLKLARDIGTDRAWHKSVTATRGPAALNLVNEGVNKFPKSWKLYLEKAQLDPDNAVAILRKATQQVPQQVLLWLALAAVEPVVRARATLAQAQTAIPKNGQLWLERFLLEKKDGKNGSHLLARGVQEDPGYGPLWFELLAATPRLQRRQKIVDALKASPTSSVLTAVGLDYWASGKAKARDWLEKAVAADADDGRAWLWLYRYSCSEASDSKNVLERFLAAKPRHGLSWAHLLDESPSKACVLFQEKAQQLENPF